MKSIVVCLICSIATCFARVSERERTFTVAQEQLLASQPKVLSFLFHMTRNRLDFAEMAKKYNLKSVHNYYNFLLENKLIEGLGNGDFRFLFLNPYGVWALRTHDGSEESIYHQLRQQGINRLVKMIKDKPVNLDDGTSSLWTVNTCRLTVDQYREYKEDIRKVGKKYTDLGEQNLLHSIADYQVVWMMHLAGNVDAEIADTSHILFGSVEEFE